MQVIYDKHLLSVFFCLSLILKSHLLSICMSAVITIIRRYFSILTVQNVSMNLTVGTQIKSFPKATVEKRT